jgi:hypothetical protein
MKYVPFVICYAVACASLIPNVARAQQIYENWNTAACGLTDRAAFGLSGPTQLTAIELWYHWGPNESEVGFALFHDGHLVKRGRLMRAACDPYQAAWCSARATVGVPLPPGLVEVRTARGRICQNEGSNGGGFVRAFGLY